MKQDTVVKFLFKWSQGAGHCGRLPLNSAQRRSAKGDGAGSRVCIPNLGWISSRVMGWGRHHVWSQRIWGAALSFSLLMWGLAFPSAEPPPCQPELGAAGP